MMMWPEKMEREMYRSMVGRQIFCKRTGKVLDIRTAVFIETPGGDRVVEILSPEGYEQVKDKLAAVPHRIVIDAKVRD